MNISLRVRLRTIWCGTVQSTTAIIVQIHAAGKEQYRQLNQHILLTQQLEPIGAASLDGRILRWKTAWLTVLRDRSPKLYCHSRSLAIERIDGLFIAGFVNHFQPILDEVRPSNLKPSV